MKPHEVELPKFDPRSLRGDIEFALWRSVYTLPRPFVTTWQSRKLRERIVRAYHRLPLYRELLSGRGITPERIKTIKDISKLPVISKNFLRSQPVENMTESAAPRGSYLYRETSGSTGEPFRFPFPRVPHLDRRNLFYLYRFLVREGVPFNYIQHSLKVARISSTVASSERYFAIPRETVREDPDAIVRQLREFCPDVLESRPTVLFELARVLQDVPRHLRPAVRWLHTYGETNSPEMRRSIEDAFGGEVFDMYGLGEVGPVGTECGGHDGFHVNEESMIVEIINENGTTCSPEEEGRVVVTRLGLEHPAPFIRYDTGDYGTLLKGLCPCGLRARRLRVFGRVGFFITVGNRRFHFSEFEKVFEQLSHSIFRYQIVKTGPSRLEIHCMPTERFSDRDIKFIREEFERRFHLVPLVKSVRHFGYSRGEKAPHFVNVSE